MVTGNLALACREYLKKGRQVFAEGRLRYVEWGSKSDGLDRYRTEIVAGRVQFLEEQSGKKPFRSETEPESTGEPDAVVR